MKRVSVDWVGHGGHQSTVSRSAVSAGTMLRGATDEADPQRRREHLGQRAEVDDSTVGVESLQRLERPAGVAELAVVVVLDDRRVVCRRPAQQGQAACVGQHDAERELVRRRHVHQARRGWDGVDDQPVLVDRHGDTVSPWERSSLTTGG